MHIGQGTNPTACCRYRPNTNSATQATLMATNTRRGAVSNQFIKKFKITILVNFEIGAYCAVKVPFKRGPKTLCTATSENRVLANRIRFGVLFPGNTPYFTQKVPYGTHR